MICVLKTHFSYVSKCIITDATNFYTFCHHDHDFMNNNSKEAAMEHKNIITPRMILILLIFIVLIPMSPLLISWQWDWWQVWFYFLINSIGFIISRLIVNRRHPDLIVERSKMQYSPPIMR